MLVISSKMLVHLSVLVRIGNLLNKRVNFANSFFFSSVSSVVIFLIATCVIFTPQALSVGCSRKEVLKEILKL